VEGSKSAEHFGNVHGPNEEEDDTGIHPEEEVVDENDVEIYKSLSRFCHILLILSFIKCFIIT